MNYFLKEELLRRKNKVFIESTEKSFNEISKEHFILFKHDLFLLGYKIDSSLEKELSKLSLVEFKSTYTFIISYLKDLLGDNKQYSFLLDNFIAKETNFISVPSFDTKSSIPLSVGTYSDLNNIFYNLLSSKTNISSSDKEFIQEFILSFNKTTILSLIPDAIPLKENVALLFKSIFPLFNEIELTELLSKYCFSATDVLRLITALSDGDISLKEPVKFKLNNKEKRIVCLLLESFNSIEEDMKRYINRWKKIGHLLHIGSKKHLYPKTFNAFNLLRNNPKDIQSFYSKLDELLHSLSIIKIKYKPILKKVSLSDLLDLLSSRPGEFGRIIDLLLRKTDISEHEQILNAFELVSTKISSTVLLQMKGNFKTRDQKELFRYFSPKGNISKLKYTELTRRPININSLNRLSSIIDSALITLFSVKNFNFKNVFIDKELLSNITIPSSLRSSSKTNCLLTRGSRIKLNDTPYIRLFLWWMNNESSYGEERIDIDLSAVAFDEDWNYVSHLDYTHLNGISGDHSGDFTDAPRPNGASEFIDLNKQSFLDEGIRYISMNVYSFSGQKFKDIECFAGVMERNNIKSEEPFNPKDVSIKYSLSGDNMISIPLYFDLKESEIIWADLGVSSEGSYHQVASNKNNVKLMGKVIDQFLSTKINLFELILLNLSTKDINIDFVKDDSKTYDFEFNKEFSSNLDEIISKWM